MKTLVLVGAGHAHALVLNAWRHPAVAGVQLILVAPVTLAPYSGMIPGWLAGQYQFDETVVDFAGLCERAVPASFKPNSHDLTQTPTRSNYPMVKRFHTTGCP